ncbi:MAG: peptide chain release factor-like protein [Burkholderia sp.]
MIPYTLDPAKVELSAMRAQGAGGVVLKLQEYRSQEQNRVAALVGAARCQEPARSR